MEASFWNERYAATEGFVFGTEPNLFLGEIATRIPAGPVLCLGEGEGRNAVYLAKLGYDVMAIDQSEVGLSKARQLATTRGVTVTTQVADLANFEIEPGRWSGIISIFCHLPPELRRRVYASAVRGLAPGGLFILEAYTPAQLAFGTGGPKDVTLLPTLAALREELAGLEFFVARELERDVIEGTSHSGRSAVVQVAARARGRT